jgi:predicted metal-dependent TIM-barrel fold hydrolase
LLPRYLEKDGVVAVGEIGFDDQTDAEEACFAKQIEIARAHNLPILIHTPHRDKKRGTIRSIELVRALKFPEERVLVDHNNEETLPIVLESACWAGHTIYPNTKMDEHRMAALVKRYGSDRIVVNSAADWGISDPLKVPKTIAALRSSKPTRSCAASADPYGKKNPQEVTATPCGFQTGTSSAVTADLPAAR